MGTMTLKINRRIKDIVGSTTLAITARAKELKAQGQDVVNFAAGEPDFDTPPAIKKAAVKALDEGFTKYTPTAGTVELRKAISEKFKKDNRLEYHPNQIVVSCGAKHSLFNLIQVLVDDGEEALIPSPYWVSYPEMVKAAGGIPRFIQASLKSKFKITPDQLEKSINPRSKVLILNSPSNPTGMLYSRPELEAIARICVQHDLTVISDEIYEKLIFDAAEYPSIGALGPDIFRLTFTVNGVSKAFAMTGWRIGYAAGPQEIMDYVKKFQDHSTSNPASISQAAALEGLRAGEETVKEMCREFKERRELMVKALDQIPQIHYVRPDGAFYVFCDISRLGDSQDVCKRILDDVKVAVIPGDGFGAPGFMRLSFATSRERIQEGIRRIAQWAKANS